METRDVLNVVDVGGVEFILQETQIMVLKEIQSKVRMGNYDAALNLTLIFLRLAESGYDAVYYGDVEH